VGAGVNTDVDVDALVLYLFGDGAEGRQAIREIDATIEEVPGLAGLGLTERVLDRALARTRARPGWAGARPAPRAAIGPAPPLAPSQRPAAPGVRTAA
jgi:hypothetical protein